MQESPHPSRAGESRGWPESFPDLAGIIRTQSITLCALAYIRRKIYVVILGFSRSGRVAAAGRQAAGPARNRRPVAVAPVAMGSLQLRDREGNLI
jgi:hypothetical protein